MTSPTSNTLTDDHVGSPQLPEKDFIPQPLPKVRQTSHDDSSTSHQTKELPVRDARPTLPQRSTSSFHEQKRQAAAQLLCNDASPTSVILRAFVPHVSVLASEDCEEILRHKGINGGLLELLRPYGETVNGRIIIRDSTGASKPWDEFGIRFIGVNDGLEPPHAKPIEEDSPTKPTVAMLEEYRPARLRTGGDLDQIDQITEAFLEQAEQQMRLDKHSDKNTSTSDPTSYPLYLRRILSGTLNSPHESFSHPVTQVIAISSRNANPIDELRTLYTSGKTGTNRPPSWVNNEFLRYYVLVHDEDHDDIKKSTTLYEQMKRHFGLHCHLLRLRSTQCLSSDDGAVALPLPEWTSAAEDLADALSRDTSEDEEQRPCIFESDVSAVQSFVREMVAQSLIPMMERSIATWNDQVASRRRGLSGRFMSLSKRFTPFVSSGRMSGVPGLSRTSSDGSSAGTPSSSGNFDPVTGAYKPESPEAIMRKLADYALMVRDYKLAQSTYDIIAADYKSDKAWKYFAGANEMSAMTALINAGIAAAQPDTTGQGAAKAKQDLHSTIEPLLENAYYNYTTRSSAPFYAVRTALLGAELLHHNTILTDRKTLSSPRRPPSWKSLDDLSTKWLCKILDDRLVGRIGHVLLCERVAQIHARRNTSDHSSRTRKTAFWNVLAACAYVEMNKPLHVRRCIAAAGVEYSRLSERGRPLLFAHAARWMKRGVGKVGEDEVDEKTVLETLDARDVNVPVSELEKQGQTLAHTDLLRDILERSETPEPDKDGFV